MGKFNKKGSVAIFFIAAVTIFVALIMGYLTLSQTSQKQTTLPKDNISSPSPISQALKTFQSKAMNFSIEIPTVFQTEEKVNILNISTTDGSISVSRVSTNFDDLGSFIQDFSKEENNSLSEQKELNINGLESVSGMINKKKLYLIYTSNRVYVISTEAEPLYDELVKIAKSFRYMP